MDGAEIKLEIQRRYGAFAETGGQREPGSGPAGADSHDELALVPPRAVDLSRACGNPTAFAGLRPGEAVVDFGCGGGLDVILAAHKVGLERRVVGVDFTPQMIKRAQENFNVATFLRLRGRGSETERGRALEAAKASGLRVQDVQLRVRDMTATGLPDADADVVISNCVINLCPDKEAVYREAFRILRPGGRLAISDMVLSEPIAPEVQERLRSSWAGCLGGAVPEADDLEMVRRAGFAEIEALARHPLNAEELDAMARCPGPEFAPAVGNDDVAAVGGKVLSLRFTAIK